MKRFLIAIAVLCVCLSARAQSVPPTVDAYFEPDSIAIGDHFILRIDITKDIVQQVGYPVYENNMIGPHIEILEEMPVDTLAREGRKITLSKKYKLTSFGEGEYHLGQYPILYLDKNITDTLLSRQELHLQVGTFEIDTLTMTIYDIKPQMNLPLKFGEISGYLGWGLLALAICGVLLWLLIRYRKQLPAMPFTARKPAEPPHVVAIRALEMLHNQKVWQNGKHKAYYTALTDIIREYLHGRYGIGAMEMTSEEILESVAEHDLAHKPLSDLTALLRTADLVKFAKFTPEADDNEAAWQNAYYFVEETKVMEPEPQPGSEE